jgi:hypothetical protein
VSGRAISGARAYVLEANGARRTTRVFDFLAGGRPLKPRQIARLDIKNGFQIVPARLARGPAGSGYGGHRAGTELYAVSDEEAGRAFWAGPVGGTGQIFANFGRLYIATTASKKARSAACASWT